MVGVQLRHPARRGRRVGGWLAPVIAAGLSAGAPALGAGSGLSTPAARTAPAAPATSSPATGSVTPAPSPATGAPAGSGARPVAPPLALPGETPRSTGPTPPVPAPVGEVAGPGGVPIAAPAPPAPSDERHLPILDGTAAESDHEAVRDAWGVQVRPVASRLSAFALRASTGCPVAAMSSAGACPSVNVSELAVRRWVGRNLAWNAGLAVALGGGTEGGRALDSYLGLGPVLGGSILLSSWKHLAVSANPELSLVFFKGAGSASTAYVARLGADLEAELQLGFIGVPALALALRSGLQLGLEHAGDATIWSLGVAGVTTVRGLFEDVALRYYF